MLVRAMRTGRALIDLWVLLDLYGAAPIGFSV